MSVAIIAGKDRLGFLGRVARDPRMKFSEIGMLAKIILTAKGAIPLEELGPEKVIRAKLQRLELLGYCTCKLTKSRPFVRNGEKVQQRNTLCFTIDCDLVDIAGTP